MPLIALPGLYCPMGCGESLMLVDEHTSGKIRCMGAGKHCPDPLAAEEILSEPETRDIVRFHEGHFSVLHPLRERIGQALLECPVAAAVAALSGPPPDGRYAALVDAQGWLSMELLPEEEQPPA